MSAKAKLSKVSVNLPFGIGGAEWVPDETEMRAAWELYVELSTRITVAPLDLDHGLVREAMNSLYAFFSETRGILRTAGPTVGAKPESVGGIAIAVLNKGIRPYLAKWHPRLLHWENTRAADVSAFQHERAWKDDAKARGELEALRLGIVDYQRALATIAKVDCTL